MRVKIFNGEIDNNRETRWKNTWDDPFVMSVFEWGTYFKGMQFFEWI